MAQLGFKILVLLLLVEGGLQECQHGQKNVIVKGYICLDTMQSIINMYFPALLPAIAHAAQNHPSVEGHIVQPDQFRVIAKELAPRCMVSWRAVPTASVYQVLIITFCRLSKSL